MARQLHPSQVCVGMRWVNEDDEIPAIITEVKKITEARTSYWIKAETPDGVAPGLSYSRSSAVPECHTLTILDEGEPWPKEAILNERLPPTCLSGGQADDTMTPSGTPTDRADEPPPADERASQPPDRPATCAAPIPSVEDCSGCSVSS